MRDLYSTPRPIIKAAKEIGYLRKVINDDKISGILERLPHQDWKKWAEADPLRDLESMESDFEKFVESRRLAAINVAC